MNQPEAGADVEQLLQLSTSGPQVLAEMDECVRRLRQVQEAKTVLAKLPTEDVRQAIERRHQRMSGPRSLT